MPRHYEDGRIFRLRSNAEPNCNGPELTFRLNDEELEGLKKIDQTKISMRKRQRIQEIVNLLISESEEPRPPTPVLDRRFERTATDGPIAHDRQTTQDALPNTKKWSERLDDIYNIYRNSGIDGMTDEEAQDAYSNMKRIDRRDIGNIVRPARNALVKCGLIYYTRKKREVRSGNKAMLWAVVDPSWKPPEKDAKLTKSEINERIDAQQVKEKTEHDR
jgi:hypothetical protein